MSIENNKIIDFINETENSIVLTISDHLVWDNSYKHQYLLQEKINAYISAIESKQIYKIYPDAVGKRVVISIALRYPPDKMGFEFLSRVSVFYQMQDIL